MIDPLIYNAVAHIVGGTEDQTNMIANLPVHTAHLTQRGVLPNETYGGAHTKTVVYFLISRQSRDASMVVARVLYPP